MGPGPVPVLKFCYPDPDPVSTGYRNLKSVPDPIRSVPDLDLPGSNRVRVRNQIPDFFAQP